MTFKSIGLSFALLACSVAEAACPALLEASGVEGKEPLTLGRCEVQVEVQSPGARGQVLLKLNEAAAQRWREDLKAGTPRWSAMLGARANVRGFIVMVPQGVLLESHSARLLPGAAWLWDARAATLLLVMPGGNAPAPAEAPALPPGVDCALFNTGRLLFWFDDRDVQAGELLASQPALVRAPHDFVVVPAACIGGWRLSPGAPAAMDAVSGIGMVAQDAKDGTTFTLIAQVGAQTVQGKMRVVDPVKHPLRGLWRQTREIACGTGAQRVPPQPLHELRFRSNGNFSATWTPFESYIDYEGSFIYDPASGILNLAVTGGNNLPVDRKIVARTRLDAGGRLIVSVLPGGSRNPTDAGVCEMIFVRR